jgi:spoIIIJ-associated protein
MSAKDTLCQMLKTLGFEATVTEQNYEDMLLLDIQTDEPNRLIGRQGQTLGEIQYLLNRILHKGDDSVPRVMLDVGGYRYGDGTDERLRSPHCPSGPKDRPGHRDPQRGGGWERQEGDPSAASSSVTVLGSNLMVGNLLPTVRRVYPSP